MILTKEEAICLVLKSSDKNTISSTTKLNKLLARLNLFFIPIDFSFTLNKYGSFDAELSSLEGNDYYSVDSYEIKGKKCHKYILKPKGKELFETNVKKKIFKILTKEEFDKLRETIHYLSTLGANQISGEEHSKLLVDVDDRFKLEQKLNEIFVELSELYKKIDEIKENCLEDVKLKALIEYSYYLIKFLREKRFNRLDEKSYDFDAYMFDYYFLHNIGEIIPFIKGQTSKVKKDGIRINKYYQYIINSVGEDYPFSLKNKNLKDLVVA